ncbi:MAG: hypothetical protein OFPII_05350 [Osedax symbiont Rs1]|nr:MAG: hypothetical protein OFPII_05350 [Osedax symbiont Rs1]
MSKKIPLYNVIESVTHAPKIYSPLRDLSTKVSNRKSTKYSNPPNMFSADIYNGKIYTKSTQGYFQRLRKYLSYFLMLAFFLIPWLEIEGRPAVLFDLQQQQFHIFAMTFWPQDAVYLVELLVLAAFLLIVATLVVGRAWCGFACPQTVWTFIFIWIEEKCEGDRNKRIKLDKQSWSANKIIRKSSKHLLWVLMSLITAYTFVGYFYEIQPLVSDTLNFSIHYIAVSWIIVFVLGTYLNAGWLREKVCMHMCPYARFQAVMYTKDTLVVTYDAQRGEARGKRKQGDNKVSEGLGDCVDCSLCVQVCPVDIDIRDGLQYPCIDCGLCVDACNTVMQKMGFEADLIRFSSQAEPNNRQAIWLRPKTILWGVLTLLICSAFFYSILSRAPLSVDVVRDRSGVLYQKVANGIENTYTINITNKGSQSENFRLDIQPNTDFKITSRPYFMVKQGEATTIVVRVWISNDSDVAYKTGLNFIVRNMHDLAPLAEQNSTFIAPNF